MPLVPEVAPGNTKAIMVAHFSTEAGPQESSEGCFLAWKPYIGFNSFSSTHMSPMSLLTLAVG